jgi:CubicO group peptidase (beta-lactamase class C family)
MRITLHRLSARSLLSLFLFPFLFLSSAAQQPYFPDSVWQTRPPATLKMNAARLDSAVAFAQRNENKVDIDLRLANLKAYANEPGYRIIGPMRPRGGPAGVIIKDGYLVAQWGDVERVDMTFSVAKSYLSTVAGMAVDKGLIRSIDDRVARYVWEDHFSGPHNGKITWRHLLNQSSDWSGCLFDVCDWADRPPREGTIDDWKARKLEEPGTRFEYNDVRVNLLAYALLQVWRRPLPQVFREGIMDPIGASSTWRWYGYENSFVNVDGMMVQSVSGGGHFGGGLFINTLDQARFGLLFLRKGRWKNRQLLSPQWVEAARQPSTPYKAYGLMWWTNEDGALGPHSRDIYYANGFGGNYIIIDNEHNLVIVTRWLEGRALKELVGRVIGAIEK